MTNKHILLLLFFVAAASPAVAREGSANVSSGCATVEFIGKMVTLNSLIPANFDDVREMEQMLEELAELNKRVCQPVILTGFSRGNTRYTSGELASTDLYHDAWYYPNGQLLFAEPGLDTTIYYPNGRIMSFHWMHGDAALFWPNGNLATNYFRSFDVDWYYPDGNVITYDAGFQGGRWFYPIGRLDGGIGQEVISSNWGEEDEDFNFLNFRTDGSIFITRERIRRKLIFDDIDLLDVPGVILMITRMYQVDDAAKQFAPADVNITGAPF